MTKRAISSSCCIVLYDYRNVWQLKLNRDSTIGGAGKKVQTICFSVPQISLPTVRIDNSFMFHVAAAAMRVDCDRKQTRSTSNISKNYYIDLHFSFPICIHHISERSRLSFDVVCS